jgi:hypothetical protein
MNYFSSRFSPENFFGIFRYMDGYVDYGRSSALGKYYMRGKPWGRILQKVGISLGPEAGGFQPRTTIYGLYQDYQWREHDFGRS